jgi:TolB-like protein/cytochrome c-type biogenesis protein CcmH/NrfG
MAESGGGNEATGVARGAPEDLGTQSGTSDVFISYASQDAAVADAVVRSLERAGLRCWIAPRDVVPGALYADEIVRAINESMVVVLVLSEQAIASPHVGKEIERASSKHRRIVALRTDSATLTRAFEYFLSESQWIDVGSAGIEAMGAKLVDAVRRHLAPGAGVEPAVPSDRRTLARKSATPQPRWILIASVAVLAMALAYFVVEKFWLSKHATSERPIAAVTSAVAPATLAISEKSIAVLPFVDMSEKKDQEYFSDGLSEELIDKLTKIPDLRVPARTSSFYFKGKSEDIPTIARRLMVAHVLEGSVRKSGMNLRITVQLVRADNGYHLWSQTYDRKLDDIFKIQDDIAAEVVSALKVSLANSSASKGTTPKNTEAYTLYLQGRAINRNAGNKAQFDGAAEYMRQAIKADPTFAEAWAGLATVLSNEVVFNYGRADPVTAEMRRAAQRSLALDPNLPDAHRINGEIYRIIDWDWEGAVAEYQKAYDLDPSDADSASALAGALFWLHGESDSVLALLQKAIDLDPVNPHCYTSIGIYYYGAGKLPEAELAYRKAIDLLPTGPGFHANLGQVLLLHGDAAAALAEFQRDPDESDQRQGAAMAYFALGRRAETDAALAEMERLDATADPAGIAEALALRRETDQAFAWLERAYQQREPGLEQIKFDPLLKSLHGDPRWKAFLRKMNLPE